MRDSYTRDAAEKFAQKYNITNWTIDNVEDFAFEQAGKLIQEFDAMLEDIPLANGQFVHMVWCNGGRSYPIDPPDNNYICNCKNLPLFKRLKAQAVSKSQTIDKE